MEELNKTTIKNIKRLINKIMGLKYEPFYNLVSIKDDSEECHYIARHLYNEKGQPINFEIKFKDSELSFEGDESLQNYFYSYANNL
jgi:hypothetical protein